MKTTKHTPGPWTYLSNGRVSQDADKHITIVQGYSWSSAPSIKSDEYEANARLIAKAPELLTALVDTLDALHNETHGQDDTPWIQAVKQRAAQIIAQATGEE